MHALFVWSYRVIALLVVVQAMAIAWMVFGLIKWVDDGNTLTHAVMESWADDHPTWDGSFGFPLHAFIIGTGALPGLALLLVLVSLIWLIVEFVKKAPQKASLKALGFSFLIFALIVAQIMLAFGGHDTPKLGLLHGLNAFVIFGTAMGASMALKRTPTPA